MDSRELQTTLAETFNRIMGECYECRDMPEQFAAEGTLFRLGWGDHTAGYQKALGTNIHRKRGWDERAKLTGVTNEY
jgi:hypothetical protein